MKKILISLAFLLFNGAAFCTIVPITDSGFTFSPSLVTVNVGDTISFSIASIHNVVEVSQATYAANGNTPLPGGFSTPFGGGWVFTDQLTTGTHWYVCQPHASLGMKGRIIVQNPTGIAENKLSEAISVYPALATSIITVKVSEGIHGTLQLYNMVGQVLEQAEINSGEHLFYIGDKPSGIYFVNIIDENSNKAVKRVVKQ